MIFYTCDLHFGHKNIIKYDNRPFKDVDEMDHVMIELYNARVQNDDIVYIIGDLCYRSGHSADWYLRQLKGHKYLIIGNHDDPVLKNPKAMELLEGIEKMMEIHDGDKHICLCHYPMTEWNSYYYGSWHVYGHIHNCRDETNEIMRKKNHALNAGCMINNYMPVTFDELVKNNEIFNNSLDDSKERLEN